MGPVATADRLYELACECRDTEERLDRLVRDVSRLEATRRAAGELAEALDGLELPERARTRLSDLNNLMS